MLTFLIVLLLVGSVVWVGVDCSRRDWQGSSSPATWVVACILLWIVAFPLYLWQRSKHPLKNERRPIVAPGSVPAQYRECPHCKEQMRRDANTCPHCRQPSKPWRWHDGHWWYRDGDDGPWQWLDERDGTWSSFDPAAPVVREVG